MISKREITHPFITQGVPLVLTVVIFVALSFVIYLQVLFLNRFTGTDIMTKIRWSDVLVGLTIYLKTSVDFAIFIGNLMHAFPGWKNRIAIEIGTAVGNALGTIAILAIWNFFRDVEILLALMIFIAALVLLKLAQEGLEHTHEGSELPAFLLPYERKLHGTLIHINHFTHRFLKYIIPDITMKPQGKLTFWGLFIMAFTVPFILGLDDFAGYVPLFSIVNVFGFSIGVLLGHMVLNILLFISPKKTIAIVKNALISFIGSIAFVALAVWGFYETFRVLFGH